MEHQLMCPSIVGLVRNSGFSISANNWGLGMVRFESNEVLPLLQKQEKFIEASRLNEVTIVGPNLLYKSEYLIYFVDSHMENELPRYGVQKSSTGYFVENTGKQEVFLDNAVYLGSALDFLY